MSSMNNNYFIVQDFKGLINSARAIVFNYFGSSIQNFELNNDIELLTTINSENQEELDNILSIEESSVIVKEFLKKQINKKTNEVRYLISDNIFLKILESLNNRMTSNILNDLVKKGLVESGYDNESNDFIFWIKNDDKINEQEKPETD